MSFARYSTQEKEREIMLGLQIGEYWMRTAESQGMNETNLKGK
jgi:hypothetical protein